jgi:hypothetical protein
VHGGEKPASSEESDWKTSEAPKGEKTVMAVQAKTME